MQQTARFGTWKSPLSPIDVSRGSTKIRDCFWDEKTLYWVEARPENLGRSTLIRHGTKSEEILPAPWNIRTRVHEYGGQACTAKKGTIYFVENADQQIYRFRADSADSKPVAVTREPGCRFADLNIHPTLPVLFAVCERHVAGEKFPRNEIVEISLRTGQVVVLVEGADFYLSPRISPAGDQLAWIEWNHPAMPWDQTRAFVADWKQEAVLLQNRREWTDLDPESVSQIAWSEKGDLFFTSDRTGWWNLYRLTPAALRGDLKAKECYPVDAEFSRPAWIFGQSQFACLGGQVVCAQSSNGSWKLGVWSEHGPFESLALPFTEFDSVVSNGERIAFIASHSKTRAALYTWHPDEGLHCVWKMPPNPILEDYVSEPQSRYCNATMGLVQFFLYPPYNPNYQAPAGTLPPLVVICHGGPTAAAQTGLNPAIQYWTTRGFAVADVNYSGSTGFGRPYRERLRGKWGILDVKDCEAVASSLVKNGEVDPRRVVIRGSSAGGLTVLNALITSPVFSAGASYYGVTDLGALAEDTHKFEAHYLDSLVGPWPGAKATYDERSPIYNADLLKKPVIFFQGLEDKVVPPSQSENLYRRLQAMGIATRYLAFAEEAHGFRRQETLVAALSAETEFYKEVLGL
jgi:dipeptidyl aminopeptidase/acylaminoacyl peptidase